MLCAWLCGGMLAQHLGLTLHVLCAMCQSQPHLWLSHCGASVDVLLGSKGYVRADCHACVSSLSAVLHVNHAPWSTGTGPSVCCGTPRVGRLHVKVGWNLRACSGEDDVELMWAAWSGMCVSKFVRCRHTTRDVASTQCIRLKLPVMRVLDVVVALESWSPGGEHKWRTLLLLLNEY